MALLLASASETRFQRLKDLRNASIAAAIGVVVLFLLYMNQSKSFGWRLAVYGAFGGLSIYVACRVLNEFLGKTLEKRYGLPGRLAVAISLFLGGILGWSFATWIVGWTGLLRFSFSTHDVIETLALTGGMGLFCGFAIYSFDVIEDRLRASVSRLKEAEFAEKELELARSIQRRLLPPSLVQGSGYRVCARNLPARFVAGDFYDVFPLPDGSVGLVTADVSGKGIGAALIMASVKAVVPLMASEASAAETLTRLNHKLSTELGPREFVALCFARFDPAGGTLEIANAGLPDPYWIRKGRGETISVPGPRWPLGARRQVDYEQITIGCEPEDRVLFLTDGLPEAPLRDGGPLGYEALGRLIAATASEPASHTGEFLDRLFDAVRAATSSVLEDDWTALLLQLGGQAPPSNQLS